MIRERTAVVIGGSGAVGSAVAKALARNGVRTLLGARSMGGLEKTVASVRSHGGDAEAFQADALDGVRLEAMARSLLATSGAFDIVVNATGFYHQQGKAIGELSGDEFASGFLPQLTAAFNIGKAFLPCMNREQGALLVTVVPPAAMMLLPGHLGHVVGCAALEAFTRALAQDAATYNVRVVAIRSHAIHDAISEGSHTRTIFETKAKDMGLTLDDWLVGAAQSTLMNRLPSLDDLAGTVVFLASDHASAINGSVVNMTGGTTSS